MASTPLAVSYRLTFPYTIQGYQHVHHLFLKTAASADPSGFDNVPRGGFVASGVSTLISHFWTKLVSCLSTVDATYQAAHLDHLLAGAWIPVWYDAATGAGTSVATTNQAQEIVQSGYTSSHEKIKVVSFEHNLVGIKRYVSVAAMPAAYQAWTGYFFGNSVAPVDTDAYAWMTGRDGTYVATWTSMVVAYNRRLRRKRGLG